MNKLNKEQKVYLENWYREGIRGYSNMILAYIDLDIFQIEILDTLKNYDMEDDVNKYIGELIFKVN